MIQHTRSPNRAYFNYSLTNDTDKEVSFEKIKKPEDKWPRYVASTPYVFLSNAIDEYLLKEEHGTLIPDTNYPNLILCTRTLKDINALKYLLDKACSREINNRVKILHDVITLTKPVQDAIKTLITPECLTTLIIRLIARQPELDLEFDYLSSKLDDPSKTVKKGKLCIPLLARFIPEDIRQTTRLVN